MDSANGFGAKLLAVIFFVVATQCTGQSSPNSLQAPFSMSIDLDPNNLPAPGNSKIVLATQEFQLWLELTGRCSLSLRRQYSAPVARLVWTANYFTVSPDGADRCTLTFTKDGDLQLWVLYRQQTFMVWNSKTGGKGVTKMALETNPDRGEFKLLTPRNQAVFSSFAIKEFAILPTQKFWAGELLKSPDTVQEIQDQDRRILLNKGHYLLAINNGDLQLLLNGPKPLVYWSLKKSGLFKGDLSQVANAAVTDPRTGGIGLFTAAGKLVWSSTLPPQGFFGDTYFGIDYYGNLRDYYMYKGQVWFTAFQALAGDCDLPNFCGDYSLCTNSTSGTTQCSCPPGFQRMAGRETSPFCGRTGTVAKCARKSFVEVKGYDSVLTTYATPEKVTLASCKTSCLASCDCDGFFYDTKTQACFKQSFFLTLRKVTAANKIAFIKV
ncbi:EP1-like glycoprotein 3 isoform X2 [Physcomitrium patens]|nr:EP1-like glycoprotein 3 isoform X2 [Physcomitrium patens]XP_024359505.1 EP1-like glycoprotein 3 isoform X2 [Physcomitrium patens]PNR32107.1 hypothetical protein PHYPA_026232 [Physcomitrium patens]|eukprot:XP_024359504.1 EP1-like glycoprotein 3 isoform X2 [Physcomitrella patens]